MVSSRLAFVAAQLAYKPGARAMGAQVLDSGDLIGDGWHRMDQRTTRVGFLARGEAWADEARAQRLVAVWRSFLQHETGRYLPSSGRVRGNRPPKPIASRAPTSPGVVADPTVG